MSAKTFPDPTDPALVAAFTAEFAALIEIHPGVLLPLTAMQAWALVTQLQLASRPPLNVGPTADIAREIAGRLQAAIAPPGTTLATVAEMGNHREFDRPWPVSGTVQRGRRP